MKRFLVLFASALVCFGFLAAPGRAAGLDWSAAFPAKAANPCGIVGCDCGCALGFPCDCGAAKKPGLTYAQGYAESLRTGKPLVVWVGHCTAAERPGLADCVQCCVSGWEGAGNALAVVARPDGQGRLAYLGPVPRRGQSAPEVVAAVRGLLAPRQATYYRPAPIFQPAPIFRGLTGGGGRRGGC